jgi:hypothetical protein
VATKAADSQKQKQQQDQAAAAAAEAKEAEQGVKLQQLQICFVNVATKAAAVQS